MMVSDCLHGQEKISRGSFSGNSLRKCLPMVHFSQIPIVEALVNKNHSLALHLQPINGSIIAAKPKVADAGAGAPRCPGRSASPRGTAAWGPRRTRALHAAAPKTHFLQTLITGITVRRVEIYT